MSKRKVEEKSYSMQVGSISDPIDLAKQQAASGNYKYLLAHADDGVIWGIVEDKTLRLSSDVFSKISPAFREKTLRELRLFGANDEWFAWRTENAAGDKEWRARTISDRSGEKGECFDESLILWGTEKDGEPQAGFQVVREADLGICHAPPISFIERHKANLVVRHYLDYDPAGVVYVKFSRLVGLENGASA